MEYSKLSSRRDNHINIYTLRERFRKLGIHAIMVTIAILSLFPAALIISGSFSSNDAIINSGYRLWPQDFSMDAYTFLFKQPEQIRQSYLVSTATTLIGTCLGLLFSAMFAYAISRSTFRLRNILAFIVFFTLLFNGGMVPLYILVTKYLNLRDTIWALILPLLINPFFILILRTFFKDLPQDYIDAAMVDGAGEWRIFFQIAAPLAKPALATIGMFYLLVYWNDWFHALLFINKPELMPLQYTLHQILANVQFIQQNMQTISSADINLMLVETIRMAMAVIAAGPATIAFLFFQKYFVRGLTIGGLKG
jgi:putative aldouronate transport system permease protein